MFTIRQNGFTHNPATSRPQNARWARLGLPLLLVAALGACDENTAGPEVPLMESTQAGFAVPFFVQAAGGGSPNSGVTPLHEIRVNAPVMAPNGQQVTLDEWNTAGGTITAACVSAGTRITANWTGLIPGGVYTMWSVVLDPGFDGTLAGLMGSLTGLGAMGATDGSQNVFIADASGQGSMTIVQPATALSMMGAIGGCALEEYEYHVVASYHIDGMTHGSDLGPDGTAVEHAGAIFKR
jgi:hypothetical protein